MSAILVFAVLNPALSLIVIAVAGFFCIVICSHLSTFPRRSSVRLTVFTSQHKYHSLNNFFCHILPVKIFVMLYDLGFFPSSWFCFLHYRQQGEFPFRSYYRMLCNSSFSPPLSF